MKKNLTVGALAAMCALAASPSFASPHIYNLNGTLADSLGGPSLVADGGTLTATGYEFGPNQGLSLSNAIDSSVYSIDMQFSFTDASGYRKILDYKDKASDSGLYTLSGNLNFYPVATGPTATSSGQAIDVLLNRDATGQITGYLDGVQQFSFADTSNYGTFTAANNVIHFFEDDAVTGFREASAGKVTKITIDSPANVATPEPSQYATAGMMTIGIGFLAFLRKRRAA